MLICQYVCYCHRPGSIRADTFRGNGLSLLALAKGMSTLFAKNDFSRPSLKTCACVLTKELYYWQTLYQQPPAEIEVYTGCGRLGNLFHYQLYKSNTDRSYVEVYINYED